MTKRGAKKRRKQEDDPVSRLAFVLLRYFRGWWDKVKLVRAGGFLSSQVTMARAPGAAIVPARGEGKVTSPKSARRGLGAARVRILAEEMLRTFRSQQVLPEALAAIRVFCEAARQEKATAELGRQVVRYLYRAKDDPGLKFEGE
jgi:hypothetical protein